MTKLDIVTRILLIAGALNWGVFGMFKVDLVAGIFGFFGGWLVTTVYLLVGLSGLYELIRWSMK